MTLFRVFTKVVFLEISGKFEFVYLSTIFKIGGKFEFVKDRHIFRRIYKEVVFLYIGGHGVQMSSVRCS